MKSRLFLILLAIPLLQCTQTSSEKNRLIVDYQGKELTEEQIQDFFKMELDHFENLNSTRKVSITKTDDVKKSLPDWFKGRESKLNLQDLDAYNIDDKLLEPFRSNLITPQEFSTIIDKLDTKLKGHLCMYFSREYYPQLTENKALLNKIITLDSLLEDKAYGFLIRCTQQAPGFQKALEDTLRSKAFYTREYPQTGELLARYAITGNNKTTFELLEIAIERTPAGEYIETPGENHLSAFEYLMLNGDEATRAKTKKLLFQYLTKASVGAAGNDSKLIAHEISEDFKNLIRVKLDSVTGISDLEKRAYVERSFRDYYLAHYARNYSMEAIPYLEKFLLSGNEDNQNGRSALFALKELTKYNKLSNGDKEVIVDLLKKADLQNSRSYLWPVYVDILKNLYPEKKFSDFASMFREDLPLVEERWSRKAYSAEDLDTYVAFLKAIGFELKDFTAKDRYLYLKQYSQYDSEGVLFGVLNLTGTTVHYDCETGMWPNPYDELLQSYLNVCAADLKNYYPLYQYEKLNDDYDTRYTALITDGTTGYLANPEDGGDWYDPITVEALLNRALKDKGISKRFMQINTGDQTVFSIYCLPGQLKLFADKFGLEIMNADTEGTGL